MRFLISAVFLISSSWAYAQSSYDGALSMSLYSHAAGCVTVDSLTAYNDFPTFPSGTATQVRFYYGATADQVTADSPYAEAELLPSIYGEVKLAVNEFCGFVSGPTYFKYAAVDASGQVLHFENDDECADFSNIVDIK